MARVPSSYDGVEHGLHTIHFRNFKGGVIMTETITRAMKSGEFEFELNHVSFDKVRNNYLFEVECTIRGGGIMCVYVYSNDELDQFDVFPRYKERNPSNEWRWIMEEEAKDYAKKQRTAIVTGALEVTVYW